MTDINNIDHSDSHVEDANLDDFAADFFSADKAPKAKPDPIEDDNETGNNSEGEPVDHAADAEMESGADEDDEGTEDPEPEADEDPAPVGRKKSRFQERIDDLTAKLREQERVANSQAEQLARALAKLEEVAVKPAEQTNTNTNTPKTETGLVEPTAEDTLDDGSPKYPLGEFDPKFLRDLTRYDRAVEREYEMKVQAEQKEAAERQQEYNSLQTAWNSKVDAVKGEYPDYVEKGQTLLNELSGIPEDYALYLTTNLMEMDYGPHVFYYLAEHPEEARAIVNSSPQKALRSLDRIEARFEIAADERSGKETKLRTTKAPEPPVSRTRGSHAQAPQVNLEDADLDTFARELFPQRRR